MARGENFYRIGLRYRVSPDEIMRANGYSDPRDLKVGTRLRIPLANAGGGRAKVVASAPRPGPRPRKGSGRGQLDYSEVRHEVRKRIDDNLDLEFDWPLRKGELVSQFGYRWGRRHHGIDIAAPTGTTIRAAEAGQVIHSGRLGSYGNVVIVSHAGRYRSLYAHARKTTVAKGQRVAKGQKIAEVGSTGKSTGPHVHFEIRKGEASRDPLLFLP